MLVSIYVRPSGYIHGKKAFTSMSKDVVREIWSSEKVHELSGNVKFLGQIVHALDLGLPV